MFASGNPGNRGGRDFAQRERCYLETQEIYALWVAASLFFCYFIELNEVNHVQGL